MVITSSPYVTSYEYADLHQLSPLLLGYAEDHRDLREGTVGSLQLVPHSTVLLAWTLNSSTYDNDGRSSRIDTDWLIPFIWNLT